jgi:hypothetical protein
MLGFGLTKDSVVSTLPSRLLIIAAKYYDSRPGDLIFCCVAATPWLGTALRAPGYALLALATKVGAMQ